MIWGYFMKLVLADRVGIYVDTVFSNAEQYTGSSLLLASLLQPIRVYGDLGGYSLIAIGCAQVLGINVIPNFNRPFFASTMSEFWRRWHISLIKWLTDYVYTPLSFSVRKFRIWGIVLALMLTFIISGIWHGAAMCFIVWGAIQGIILSIETLAKKRKESFENKYRLRSKWWYILYGCTLTYLLFSFSLIFGATGTTVAKALSIIRKIFTNSFNMPHKDGVTMLFGALAFGILFIKEFMEEYHKDRILLFNNKNIAVRWASYYFVIFCIFYFGVFGGEKFVYFQF
jgi:D-alanyl-lipoteichoic acid acyltransferase DltB (MBOAT superfamily)